MATSSTSYLQTLAKDEAIAFVASLQSIKAHLSQEVLWMETQVQQKTMQLQGIACLLSEAEAWISDDCYALNSWGDSNCSYSSKRFRATWHGEWNYCRTEKFYPGSY